MGNDKLERVVIAGAGPTGLALALMLARRGVEVEVVEAMDEIDQRPRGLGYGPPGIRVLARTGVLDEARRQTHDVREMSWRDIEGQKLAGLSGLSEGLHPDRWMIFPVHKLSNLLFEQVQKQANVSVRFQHRVIGVGQDADRAWVDVMLAGGETRRFEGNLVVGCDGASSGVRKSLYGDEFPGTTWPRQLIATNVRIDIDKHGWSDMQWLVDPEYWGVVAKIEGTGKDQVWRVCYGEAIGLSTEELAERLPAKFEKMLPGHPKPGEYEVIRFSPFVMHQRCVAQMRIGRILLAGDAAHLCNPMGGLGLTGGLSDIGSLIDCLYGILDGKTDMTILDKWDEIRRKIYYEYIDRTSTINMERILKKPQDVKGKDPFFQELDRAGQDREIFEKMRWHELLIGHDMTQYFAAAA